MVGSTGEQFREDIHFFWQPLLMVNNHGCDSYVHGGKFDDGSKDVSEGMDGWRGAVLSAVLQKNGIQFQKCFSPSCRPKRQVGLT